MELCSSGDQELIKASQGASETELPRTADVLVRAHDVSSARTALPLSVVCANLDEMPTVCQGLGKFEKNPQSSDS